MNDIADYLNGLSTEIVETELQKCCAAEQWIAGMMELRPFASDVEVLKCAQSVWESLSEEDYLQAFAAHPQIGDVASLRHKYVNTRQIADDEQSGVREVSEDVLTLLAERNRIYFEIFGFIFIVFATGKSADEMLAILNARLSNDRETELSNARAEQLKITKLRLQTIGRPK